MFIRICCVCVCLCVRVSHHKVPVFMAGSWYAGCVLSRGKHKLVGGDGQGVEYVCGGLGRAPWSWWGEEKECPDQQYTGDSFVPCRHDFIPSRIRPDPEKISETMCLLQSYARILNVSKSLLKSQVCFVRQKQNAIVRHAKTLGLNHYSFTENRHKFLHTHTHRTHTHTICIIIYGGARGVTVSSEMDTSVYVYVCVCVCVYLHRDTKTRTYTYIRWEKIRCYDIYIYI